MKNKKPSRVEYLLKNPHSIREIMNLIEEYRYHPQKFKRKLIYLAGGWPQDSPPSLIKDSIIDIVNNEEKFLRATQYGPTKGLTEFHQTIVDYEKEIFGRKIDENQLIVGNGSTELTLNLIRALIEEEDEIILTRPFYLNYYRQIFFESFGKVKVKFWNLIKDDFEPSLEELKNLITNKTSFILISSPGNPDAQVLSDDMFKSISEIAKDKNVYLLTDIAYRCFCYEKEPNYFSKDVEEHEVFICTFSKELRSPGLRMAYLIGNENIIKDIEVIEQISELCPNSFSQMVIKEALSTKEKRIEIKKFIEERKKIYHNASKIAYETITAIPEIRAIKPKAAFYVFFNHEKIDRDSRSFCNNLLKEYQVALAPGIDFGMDGWSRLSFSLAVLNPEIVIEGIHRIKEMVENSKIEKIYKY